MVYYDPLRWGKQAFHGITQAFSQTHQDSQQQALLVQLQKVGISLYAAIALVKTYFQHALASNDPNDYYIASLNYVSQFNSILEREEFFKLPESSRLASLDAQSLKELLRNSLFNLGPAILVVNNNSFFNSFGYCLNRPQPKAYVLLSIASSFEQKTRHTLHFEPSHIPGRLDVDTIKNFVDNHSGLVRLLDCNRLSKGPLIVPLSQLQKECDHKTQLIFKKKNRRASLGCIQS